MVAGVWEVNRVTHHLVPLLGTLAPGHPNRLSRLGSYFSLVHLP